MKEWVGIVCIKNNQLLMVREKDSDVFTLPGGTVEKNETVGEALKREIQEELNISIELQKTDLPWKEYTINGKNEGLQMKFILYRYELSVAESKGKDIAEVVWVNPFNKKEPARVYGAITTEKLFPLLFWLGQLTDQPN